VGHGFGSGLRLLAPLGGLQARCSGRCGRPLGLFRAPESWGIKLPPPWALPGIWGGGGQRKGRERGVAGKAVRTTILKAPPRTKTPPQAGRRVMAAAVAWWRAGVQCGHEGHAQSPRVCVRACVRAWGWPRRPLPRAGRGEAWKGEGCTGRGFPRLAQPPARGLGARGSRRVGRGAQRRPAQSVAGSRGRDREPRATR
jgi:hypothetical protein